MGKPTAIRFYWSWAKHVLGAPTRADGIVSISGSALVVAAHYFPIFGEVVTAVWWQYVIYVLALVTVFRVVTAPFHIWKADQLQLASLMADADQKQKKRETAEALVPFLNEGMELYHRGVGSDAELTTWQAEVMDWRQRLFQEITNRVGFGTAQSVEHIAGLLAADVLGSYSPAHSQGRQQMSERIKRLRELITRLEAEA